MNAYDFRYLTIKTRLTNYTVIPNEIFKMEISSTAKLIYVKLLNRARISVSNNYFEQYGRAYVIYLMKDLSKELNIGVSAIKITMRELAEAGLIEKRRSKTSRANMIFVKVPLSSIMGQISVCEPTGYTPYKGDKSIYPSGKKVARSKNNKNKKINLVTDYRYNEGDSF